MKITILPIFALSAIFVLSSGCQKEIDYANWGNETEEPGNPDPETNQDLTGEWDIVAVNSEQYMSVSFVEEDGIYKSVTTSDFTGKNPQGTFRFTADSVYFSNVKYTVDTLVYSYTYKGNVLINSISVPAYRELTSPNGESKLQLKGADTLIFTSPDYTDITGSPDEEPAMKDFKYHYQIKGDSLFLNYTEKILNEQEAATTEANIAMKVKLKKR